MGAADRGGDADRSREAPADTVSPADTLKTLFRDIFQCRGRNFGSASRGVLGISDGNEAPGRSS